MPALCHSAIEGALRLVDDERHGKVPKDLKVLLAASLYSWLVQNVLIYLKDPEGKWHANTNTAPSFTAHRHCALFHVGWSALVIACTLLAQTNTQRRHGGGALLTFCGST